MEIIIGTAIKSTDKTLKRAVEFRQTGITVTSAQYFVNIASYVTIC